MPPARQCRALPRPRPVTLNANLSITGTWAWCPPAITSLGPSSFWESLACPLTALNWVPLCKKKATCSWLPVERLKRDRGYNLLPPSGIFKWWAWFPYLPGSGSDSKGPRVFIFQL